MGKFGQNREFFENPLIFRVLGFSQRAKKNPNGQLKFPRFGKNPEIWSHCFFSSESVLRGCAHAKLARTAGRKFELNVNIKLDLVKKGGHEPPGLYNIS